MRISDWSSTCALPIFTSGLGRAVAFVRAMFAVFPLIVGAAVGRIGSFLSGIWDGITNGLQAALNGAIWLINSAIRSEEHTSELQSLMRISYAVFCLTKKNKYTADNYSTFRKTQS